MTAMRRAAGAFSLVVLLLAGTSCGASTTSFNVASAIGSLGWRAESFSATTNGGGHSASVVLRSLPSTPAIDRAAAGVLAALASEVPSNTPVSVTFKARGLQLSTGSDNWGNLSYNWGTPGSQGRGNVVQVYHGDTGDPHKPPCASAYVGRLRGSWARVDVSQLRQWYEHGPPEPTRTD